MVDANTGEVPTHYANIVTVTVDPDVAYLEIRQYIRPHREFFSQAGPATSEPAESGILAQEPIALVVLTYTAAKALHASLGDLIPQMERVRRGVGQP
jgi:hypothetical protein